MLILLGTQRRSWVENEILKDQAVPRYCMFDIFFPCIISKGQELSTELLRRDLSGPYILSPNKILGYTQTTMFLMS